MLLSVRAPESPLAVLLFLWAGPKLQALAYDILPSTIAVFSYAIGSRKLSANEQFFVGAQTVVRLLQTTQIVSDVDFVTDHVAYASSNTTKSFQSRRNSFFFFFFIRGGKRRDLGLIPLRLSFLFKKVVVCGHCPVTLSITFY